MILQSLISLTNLKDFDKNLSEIQNNLILIDLTLNDKNQTTYDRHNRTIIDNVSFESLLKEIFNSIPIRLIPFIIGGCIILPCLFIIWFCFCLRKSSKSRLTKRTSKAKMSTDDLSFKQPVVTTSLNTSVSTQTHEDTVSVTNIQLDKDLNQSSKKDLKHYLSNKENSHATQNVNKRARENISKSSVIRSSNSHISRPKKKSSIKMATILPKSFFSKSQETLPILYDQKNMKQAETNKNRSKLSVYTVEPARSNHSIQKSRKESDFSVSTIFSVRSRDGPIPKERSSSKVRSESDKRHRSKSKDHRKSKRKYLKNRMNSKLRNKKSFKKKKTKVDLSNLELKNIKIYDKILKIDHGSNELISIFKQIPNFSVDKLPSPKILYSPPSENTLKKAKPIELSSSSSEEEIIRDYKKFKPKSKDKLKTNSNIPLLDDNLLESKADD